MANGARRFRRGLPVEQVEVDGYKFFEVHRPGGEPFRLYDFEHHVATELDGAPLAQVARAVKEKHGLELTELQVMAFVDRLGELDLLEPEDAPDREQAAPAPPPGFSDDAEDAFANEPTAGHNLATLRGAMSARPAVGPGMGSEMGSGMGGPWNEAEPTALMSSMSELLAVSRSKTGEADVMPTPQETMEGSPPDMDDGAPPPFFSALNRPTQELRTSAARFDQQPFPVPASAGPASGGPGFTEPAFAEPGFADRDALGMPPQVEAMTPFSASEPLPSRGRPFWIWALVAVALAAAIGFAVYKLVTPSTAPVSVNTLLPAPTAVYRWFETAGQLQDLRSAQLSIPLGGKVVELRPAGTKFVAGETLALTEDGKRLRKDIDHLKERRAYYQQMLEAMTAEGNKVEARQAELKLKEKQLRLDEALRELGEVAIVASADGVIAKTLVQVGDKVKPGEPVLTLDAQQVRAVFKLPREEAEQAQRLAFCRVQLDDKPYNCNFVSADDADVVVVELPIGTVLDGNVPAYLARARFDSVFAVPGSAVVQVGNTERVFVAGPNGRAEMRAVALADRSEGEALVAQGLDLGDAVIVDAPTSLRANAPVRVAKRVLQ